MQVTQKIDNLGLNSSELRELGQQWAGFVFGRISAALEYAKVQFKEVFHKY